VKLKCKSATENVSLDPRTYHKKVRSIIKTHSLDEGLLLQNYLRTYIHIQGHSRTHTHTYVYVYYFIYILIYLFTTRVYAYVCG
jgi:hypothetical protein